MAKIARKKKNQNKYSYGFMFLDIKMGDFEYLKKILYAGKI
jgi:hypothetical protein